MKKAKWGQLALAAILLLGVVGCGDKDKEKESGEALEVIKEGDYAALLPYQSSDASIKHATLNTNMIDTLQIGTGLMELSKEYFSSDTHTFREGEFLDFDTLDAATDQSSGLLGRFNKKTNSIGLNPAIKDEFPVEGGDTVKIGASDILLLDIQEFDWYKNGELAGLSLAFVLNDEVGEENNTQRIREDKMDVYAKETVRKAVNYIRKKIPGVGNDLPIFVALYDINSADEALPGTFYQAAFFETKIDGDFYDIKENWVLFPTQQATDLDGATAASFDRYKAAFKNVMPQDVSMIAKGHYMKNALQELRIQVTLHASTSGEVMTAVQLLNKELSEFPSDYMITVDIQTDTSHVGVIQRDKGAKDTNVITLM